MRGASVEHEAWVQGVPYAPCLQQETSEYYRTLTPALETLVSGALGWRDLPHKACTLPAELFPAGGLLFPAGTESFPWSYVTFHAMPGLHAGQAPCIMS